MLKKPNGQIDWFKVIMLIAAVAIIVTAIVIPVVNKVKASIPQKEEATAVVNAAKMLFKI